MSDVKKANLADASSGLGRVINIAFGESWEDVVVNLGEAKDAIDELRALREWAASVEEVHDKLYDISHHEVQSLIEDIDRLNTLYDEEGSDE